MKNKKTTSFILTLISLLVLSVSSFAFNKIDLSKPIEINEIEYTEEMKTVDLEVLEILENHYKKLEINDDLSEKFFYKYIETLDPTKSLFLSSDIKDMEEKKDFFDDAIKMGYLDFAFNFYNKYQKIQAEKLIFSIKTVEEEWGKIDFQKNDYIETDPKKQSYPKTKKERQKRWYNKVKNDILTLELLNKDKDKIQDIVSKRYRSLLRSLLQVKNMDVFNLYINSFTSLYDGHTDYFSPQVSKEFDIHMTLSFEGIGATLSKENEHTKVVNIIPGGPAEKEGSLKAEDIIIGVGQGDDGEIVDVVGWRIDSVVQIIRGKKRSVVRLEVIPKNSANKKSKIIRIVRDKVTLKDQEAKKEVSEVKKNGKTYKIGVITIPSFYLDFSAFLKNDKNYKSVSKDVKKILLELNNENVDGIIIDVRQNGGGSLLETPNLTGLFIKDGPVVQVKNNKDEKGVYEDKDKKSYYDKPLLVMIDRYSASASEIFAGAIKDYKRGLIVGSTTFGKGTVQNISQVSKGTIKYTTSKFYRISGESTQQKGVTPDIEMPSLYDNSKVGESSYENTLVWDTIKPLKHKEYSFVTKRIVKKLNKKHKKRISKDINFIALKKNLELIKEINEKTKFSLNIEKRKKEFDEIEKQKLAIINEKRRADGEKELKSLDEAKNLKEDKKDVFLKESQMILCDYIDLLSK